MGRRTGSSEGLSALLRRETRSRSLAALGMTRLVLPGFVFHALRSFQLQIAPSRWRAPAIPS
jgi:hypothetical protein